jgi:hypothetical protein
MAVACLVGPAVLLHLGRGAVGLNPAKDFQIMTWSLKWWPWALRHGVNPLQTRLLWPPAGFSTLWMTSVPAAAALAAPLTLTSGPLVAYNVLMILAIPLAAAGAFLLCRELCGRFLPALVGGLLFGLSPYLLGHLLSQHLNLVLVFPLPLIGLFCVRYVRHKTRPWRLVCMLALLLALQLGFSLELFSDLTLLLGLGCVIALVGGVGRRRMVLRLAGLLALSYAVLLPLLVPIAILGLGGSHGAVSTPPSSVAIDLVNVVVATPTLLAGAGHAAGVVSRHFVGNIGEQDGYLGLPLIAAALAALVWQWRRGAWLVGGLLACALVLSLGPVLTLAGRPLVGLPFALAHLPVLSDLLPARLSIFTALAASVLVALLLARFRQSWLRLSIGALLVASMLPNFWAGRLPGAFGYATPQVSNGFVSDSQWRGLIAPGATVLVLPAEDGTAAEWWQAESGMRFALAVPETPFPPPALAAEPVMVGLLRDQLQSHDGVQLAAARLRTYLQVDHVADVVVTAGAVRRWRATVALATATDPRVLGTDRLYRVSPKLRPLRAIGERRVEREQGQVLTAWLAFNGKRACVRVVFRRQSSRRSKPTTLSPMSADADSPVIALGPRRRATVVFTQYRAQTVLLRVATSVGDRWRIDTLDSSHQAIRNVHAVLLAGGTTLVTWTDRANPVLLRAAALTPAGKRQVVTLDDAPELRSVALEDMGGRGIVAFGDAVASESRLRVAIFAGGRWDQTTTVGSGLWALEGVTLSAGRGLPLVRWQVQPLDARLLHFAARLRGGGSTSWRSVPSTLDSGSGEAG